MFAKLFWSCSRGQRSQRVNGSCQSALRLPRCRRSHRLLLLEVLEARTVLAPIVLGPGQLQFGIPPVITESIFTAGSPFEDVSVRGRSDSSPEVIPLGSTIGVLSVISAGQAEMGGFPTWYEVRGKVITKGGSNDPSGAANSFTKIDLQGEVTADTVFNDNRREVEITGRIGYSFMVLPRSQGIPLRQIPIKLITNGDASVSGERLADPEALTFSFVEVSAAAMVRVDGPSFDSPGEQEVGILAAQVALTTYDTQVSDEDDDQFSEAPSFNAPVGAAYDVSMTARAIASVHGGWAKATFQVIVDPLIYIDPTYEFADDYFVLFNTPHVTGPDYVVASDPWYNEGNPLDVNNSGGARPISALDALIIFNLLNSQPQPIVVPREAEIGVPFFYDTNGDLNVSPIDALLVFNFLNSSAALVEPESASAGSSSVAGFSSDFDLSPSLADVIGMIALEAGEQSVRRRRLTI